MYFNVNFNVFFKLIKVHLLVSELYVYQNARCNDKKKKKTYPLYALTCLQAHYMTPGSVQQTATSMLNDSHLFEP